MVKTSGGTVWSVPTEVYTEREVRGGTSLNKGESLLLLYVPHESAEASESECAARKHWEARIEIKIFIKHFNLAYSIKLKLIPFLSGRFLES